ncbi:ATP-binding protein [Amycolatopsis sp. NPDC003865]
MSSRNGRRPPDGSSHGARTDAAAPRPRQLPRDVTHFIGREDELRELDSLLDAPRRTVVISAISGAAGVGKTSLAIRWAHRVEEHFPDGQLYANLRGYDPGEPLTALDVLGAFLRAMDVPGDRIADEVEAMAATFRSVLAGRRILVVLDNAATPEQVRPLLPNEPGCLVVVTSRNALSGLVARDGAHRIDLDVLAPEEAYALLKEVIRDGRAEREVNATIELTRQCAYLPLALRIAAERVVGNPHVEVADLARDLVREHRRLDFLAFGDDEASAVETVFSWSYEALPEELSRTFRLLSLHPGPVIGIAAAADLLGVSIGMARHRMDSLVAVHLIAEVAAGRFQFHDLLRIYAGKRASDDEPAESREAAIARCYQWYLHTAHAALYSFYPEHPQVPIVDRPADCRPLLFGGREEARRWFAMERQNLMAVVQRAPEVNQYTVGWQLPNALDCFLAMHHFKAERIAIHQCGLAAALRVEDRLGEQWAHGHLGEAFQAALRYDEAISCHLRSLSIADEFGDGFGQAASLNDLGTAYLALGRFEEAVDHLRRALEKCRSIRHSRNEGTAEVNLGAALSGLGLADDALKHAYRGLRIFQRMGAVGSAGWALWTLGRIWDGKGSADDAIRHLRDAVDVYGEAAQNHHSAEVLVELGRILRRIGRTDEALDAWRTAHAIFTGLGSAMKEDVEVLLADDFQSS